MGTKRPSITLRAGSILHRDRNKKPSTATKPSSRVAKGECFRCFAHTCHKHCRVACGVVGVPSTLKTLMQLPCSRAKNSSLPGLSRRTPAQDNENVGIKKGDNVGNKCPVSIASPDGRWGGRSTTSILSHPLHTSLPLHNKRNLSDRIGYVSKKTSCFHHAFK